MLARFSLLTISSAIAALIVPTLTNASSLSIRTGDPQRSGVVSTTWRDSAGNALLHLDMPVDGTMTTTDMAAVTAQQLRSSPLLDPNWVFQTGDMVHVDLGAMNNPFVYSVDWGSGTTAQDATKLMTPDIGSANIAAVGHFQPFYQPQQPAIFTAGIITDVGELTAQISAQELNFQTDGPIICQALFQRLAPRAPQYGAQINYAGDRLEVYFDPAYTVTQGGIIFGTTSPSQGFSGTIIIPAEPLPGDSNGDGVVDSADYVELRKGVPVPYTQGNYDLWRSHFGDNFSAGGVANMGVTVPEPASSILMVFATVGWRLCQRGRRIERFRS